MTTRRFVRLRRFAGTVPVAASLLAFGPAVPAAAQNPPPTRAAAPAAVPAAAVAHGRSFTDPQRVSFDPAKLRVTLDATHEAGMYGLYSAVRHDDDVWRGASGVADVRTRRPVRPDMRHRVGSVTKTFTAVAVLGLVEQGRLELDAPIARYLPGTVPGERGQKVTVRMLLDHTSGIGDYVVSAFPSWRRLSPESLDENRFRTLRPEQLIAWGLEAPPTNAPGEGWSYSNTNYVIIGKLLEKVTGVKAETYIQRSVIRPAGLKSTYFPAGPFILGSYSRMYEALYGYAKPVREYSVYDMSWAGTAGALVSTTDDLNRFYRSLLTGKLIGTGALAEMQRTVPVKDADGNTLMNYGLGIYSVDLPCGRFWGHDGAVFGAGTQALSSNDGRRQLALGLNLTKYQQLNGQGVPMPHAIDNALGAHFVQALCGDQGPLATETPGITTAPPLPLQYAVRR
ncbi:serine hydrolase domain-containing protein [Actinomadura viridis]|uniref:serine hydrolase domain-containing protein n=1 Tax=Actinomadura viridis TaxID=58110 RepID=UPI0036988DCC